MPPATTDTEPRRSAPDQPFNRRRLGAKALFLLAGTLSFLLSVYLWFDGSKEQGIFVGLWVPSIFSLGALVLASDREGGR